jgi:hypothetical protein
MDASRCLLMCQSIKHIERRSEVPAIRC